MTSFSSEQLNFFKFSTIVIDEFPVALRKVFVFMWDTLIAPAHGCQQWDNSAAVLNLFLSKEGGAAKVPTLNKSHELWDCTALFKATLFAQTFAIPDGSGKLATLNTLYVKPRGLLSGVFHTSVISLVGNQAERFALALDQLRLLRNTLCHQSSTRKIDKATFDHHVLLAKDAFAALGQDSAKIDDIGKLGEDDFPTARVQQLEDELKKEKDTAIKFKQIEDHLDKIELQGNDVMAKVEEVSSDIKEVKADIKDLKQAKETKSLKGPLVPASCIPDKIPHFIGRVEECRAVLDHLSKPGDTRVVDIFGSPGFGKTSVAINVAHQLREMNILVYFISLRGMKSKDELISRLLSIFADATQVPQISPSHWLIRCLQQLQNPFVLILDNADDVLESGDTKMKQEVLTFMEEILAQCSDGKLLFTTRVSLNYLNHKLSIHVEKVSMLDKHSSASLVMSLLPDVSADACSSILKECGQVPLVMRLMCSIISEENVSVDELTLELKNVPLVTILDNECFSDDVRLKMIINTSFQRLSSDERDAFVSLTVFPGWFGAEDATEVLQLKHVRPMKMIRSLERKSLIDCSDKSFTIHSLLRSFIDEKRRTDKDIGAVFHTAQHHFFDNHISSFDVANEKFLVGRSTEAVHAFFGQRESILLSLENGTKDDELHSKTVEALSKAELFLYAVLPDEELLFNMLYDTAIKEAKNRKCLVDERKLLAAKSFGHWGWFSEEQQTWHHSLCAMASYINDADCPAKLLCYYGIYQILCGVSEKGISSVEDSNRRLSNCCDESVLRELAKDVLIKTVLKRESIPKGLNVAVSTALVSSHAIVGLTAGVASLHVAVPTLLSIDFIQVLLSVISSLHSMLSSFFSRVMGNNAPTMKPPTAVIPKQEQTPKSDGNRANLMDDIIFFCVRMKLLHYIDREKRFAGLDRLHATGTASSRQEISSFLKECSKALRMMSSIFAELKQKQCLVMDRGASESLLHLANVIDQLSPDSWYPLLICKETFLQMDSILQVMRTSNMIEDDACASIEEQLALLRHQLQTFLE